MRYAVRKREVIALRRTGVWIVALAMLGLIFSRTAGAIDLTEKQEAFMEKGKVKELAKSITKGSAGRIDRICTLYLFVRENIKSVDALESHSSPGQVLRNKGGRGDDKARLLAQMLKKAGEESYLVKMNLVKYGGQITVGFVAVKATDSDATKLARFTGGGSFIRFPRTKGRKPFYIPLVPEAGYSIGRLSADLYEETKDEGWKEWKIPASFSKYSAQN